MAMKAKRMTIEDADKLRYYQMPQDGGQIVSITYAVNDGWSHLYCCSEDRSELPGSVDRVSIQRIEIDDNADPTDSEFEPQNGKLPATTGEWETLYSLNHWEIADALVSAGPSFSGANVHDEADGWIEAGFDSGDVSDWVDAGFWDADMANLVRSAGVTADQIGDIVDRLMDGLDEDELREKFRGNLPVYALCNGDFALDAFLAAR